jgi:quercetin dioxygenase-like cupin family protein
MKVYNKRSLPENTDTCCINTQIQELTAQATGDSLLNIKFFEMNPDGYSPLHSHPSRHQLIITDGEGTVFDGQKTTAIKTGDIAYIMPNEPHQLRTTGDKPLKFICLTI